MKHILPTIAALLLSTPSALHAVETPKPSIVFIFADDWGWGVLSCHGQR